MTLTRARIEQKLAKLDAWNGNGLHPEDAAKEQAEIEFEKEICRLALSALAPSSGWRPLSTAPDTGYHLLADSTEPHLSGVFLGQVVYGKAWDPARGVYRPADVWMPVTPPGTEATPPQGERVKAMEEVVTAFKAWRDIQTADWHELEQACARLDGIEKGGGG